MTTHDLMRQSIQCHGLDWDAITEHACGVAEHEVMRSLDTFRSGGPCTMTIAMAIISLIVEQKAANGV